MNLTGQKVKHRIWGSGVVTSQTETTIEIEFSIGVKRLQYPEAFEKFVVVEDTDIQTAILDNVREKKILEEKEKSERVFKSAKDREIDSMFGEDYHADFLARNPILTYQQVESQFGIKISGFGRGINPTPFSVVLISSINKSAGNFVYHDKWTLDGDYIYSGEGKTGNQSMTKGNLAIKNASRDNKKIHLFVKFSAQEYYYQGEFKLVDYTYEDDMDEAGNTRKEYKFKLRKVNP